MSDTELQKRADRANQSVLFFLASANFWEKHAKNIPDNCRRRGRRCQCKFFWQV